MSFFGRGRSEASLSRFLVLIWVFPPDGRANLFFSFPPFDLRRSFMRRGGYSRSYSPVFAILPLPDSHLSYFRHITCIRPSA